MKITELLARRTDLSTFLVHLTRATPEASAKGNLLSIIRDDRIRAKSPFGMAGKKLEDAGLPTLSQRCVCFTETPLEYVGLLAEEIENRTFHFEPYGIAVTRRQGRRRAVNPVWYLDITPGYDWLTNPVNELIDEAIGSGSFDESQAARLAPFIEQMGSWPGAAPGDRPYRKEFWWEREWRHVGDFQLPPRYIVLCPAIDSAEIQAAVAALDPAVRPSRVSYIDPTWSLEMIIGRLAGFDYDELGPF